MNAQVQAVTKHLRIFHIDHPYAPGHAASGSGSPCTSRMRPFNLARSSSGLPSSRIFPSAHEPHPCTASRFIHIGGADQNCHAFLRHQADDELPEILAGDRVNPCGGLIQQEHLG